MRPSQDRLYGFSNVVKRVSFKGEVRNSAYGHPNCPSMPNHTAEVADKRHANCPSGHHPSTASKPQ